MFSGVGFLKHALSVQSLIKEGVFATTANVKSQVRGNA